MLHKFKVLTIVSVILLSLIITGCEEKETILLQSGYEASAAVSESAGEEKEADSYAMQDDKQEDAKLQDAVSTKEEPETFQVHVCGAVKEPGVYSLEKGSRVYQAVEKAGGFTEAAGKDFLNLADLLKDGMKLYVPTGEEISNAQKEGLLQEAFGSEALSDSSGETADGLVNINNASEEQLCTLPGIGSGKAKSIISYREKNGSFNKPEDIMKVEGIKDGLFHKIKDSITV